VRLPQSDLVSYRSAKSSEDISNPVSTRSLRYHERGQYTICYRVVEFPPELNQRWLEASPKDDLMTHDITHSSERISNAITTIDEGIRERRSSRYRGPGVGNEVWPAVGPLTELSLDA
jgi:hypothetical protein